MKLRDVIDLKSIPLIVWQGILCFVALAACIASNAFGGILSLVSLPVLVLFCGFTALGVAFSEGHKRGLLASSLVVVGLFVLVLVAETISTTLEALLPGSASFAPDLAPLVGVGLLRCVVWVGVIALAVHLVGCLRPFRSRVRAVGVIGLIAVILAGGAAMGLVDAWWAAESLSSFDFGSLASMRTVAFSADCLFTLIRWVVGSVALLAILGKNPLIKFQDLPSLRDDVRAPDEVKDI